MTSLTDWLRRSLLLWGRDRSAKTSPRWVTRFITHRKHKWAEGGFRLKPVAFLPRENPTTGEMETSVFLINDLSEEEIWSLGREHVCPKGRNLHGRGDLEEPTVRGFELTIELDNSPPRHGNLVGWPPAEDDRLALALQLSQMARHVAPP